MFFTMFSPNRLGHAWFHPRNGAQVMSDRGTGRSRGFGFVSFEVPEPVDQIMSMHKAERPAAAEKTPGAVF